METSNRDSLGWNNRRTPENLSAHKMFIIDGGFFWLLRSWYCHLSFRKFRDQMLSVMSPCTRGSSRNHVQTGKKSVQLVTTIDTRGAGSSSTHTWGKWLDSGIAFGLGTENLSSVFRSLELVLKFMTNSPVSSDSLRFHYLNSHPRCMNVTPT